uniref:Protein STB5 n=1 Tax=Talaromyces marneffei PM1 TaxID=1077442 RepID=A0A093XUG4_TALMA
MKGAFQQFRVSKPPPRNGRCAQQPSHLTTDSEQLPVSVSESTTVDDSEASSRHPAQSACERCRRLKKKCTRTAAEGACGLCIAAWVPCSFPKSVQRAHEREKALQERILWLSRFVNEARLPNAVPVELIETGHDLTVPPAAQPPIAAEQPSIDRSHPWSGPNHEQGSSARFGTTERNIPDTPTSPSLLDKATGSRLVDAYFRHVHRAYPFLDREQVIQSLDSCFRPATDDTAFLQIACIPTRLAVVMAIGRTTLQRVNEIATSSVPFFDIPEKEIIHECLCKNDLTSVEILTLLALYSLFEANSIPPGSIVGILSRKVISMGLIRDSGSSYEISQVELERRRRLFWSAYVLDRMISVSYGLPPSINDEDIAIPLPSITVDEYASPDRYYYAMTLQVNRHVVALRRLEGKIMQNIHLSSSQRLAAITPSMSTSYYEDTRREIDDWYTQGCLMSSSAMNDNDHLPFHNTITWHNVRYQNLYVLLYSPSRLNADRSMEEIEELQAAAGNKHDTQASLLSSTSPRSTTGGKSKLYEIATHMALCVRIMESFSEDWKVAKRAADIFGRFVDYVAAQQSTPFVCVTTHPDQGLESLSRHYDPVLDAVMAPSVLDAPLNDEQLPSLQTIRQQILELIKDTLGETTIYAYAVKELESTAGLMKTGVGSRLSPSENYGRASIAASEFPEPDVSADRSGRGMSLWLDVMDDLGLGVL